MDASRWKVWLGMVLILLAASAAQAQQMPRIGCMLPAGGRRGTTFEVTVSGQFLDTVSAARITGPGVQAKIVEHTKPLTSAQAQELRDRARELQEKRQAAFRGMGPFRNGPATTRAATQPATQPATRPVFTAADEKELLEIRQKLMQVQKRQTLPALADTVVLQVTLSADAPAGPRELRLTTAGGLTNPLVFQVGTLPEVVEKESQETDPQDETAVTLPATINGRIMPGDVDHYRFKARQGQKLVAAASARTLIPYLADAVPGWFQAVLRLTDAQGREVAYADSYQFNPDPVLFCEIPKDGEYILEIHDSIYRGRDDFVYRIAVGELPFVTSIFPLGGKAGAPHTVEVRGWNLPSAKASLPVHDTPGAYTLTGKDWINSVPFALDSLPEVMESEPNNTPGSAQAVTPEVIINGRIENPSDRDVYRFEGKAGQEIVAEVMARRLGSPLDSVLQLTDAAGKQVAFNDDHEDKAVGLQTHYADSYLLCKLPADGTYYLHISDAQHQGGPEYGYRLRIGAPRPDFALRVAPSSALMRIGASSPITVYALRKDGFAGEIVLTLKDAPPGVGLSGGKIAAGQDQVRLTLTMPPAAEAFKGTIPLHLEGRATIAGTSVMRPAVPAEDMMQAFAYRHLVPAQEFLVVASDRNMARRPVRVLSATPVKIPAGGSARVLLGMPLTTPMGPIELELNQPPDGITLGPVTAVREATELVVRADKEKVKPGLKGNLIITVVVQRTPPNNPQGPKRRVPVATLPAVPFEVGP